MALGRLKTAGIIINTCKEGKSVFAFPFKLQKGEHFTFGAIRVVVALLRVFGCDRHSDDPIQADQWFNGFINHYGRETEKFVFHEGKWITYDSYVRKTHPDLQRKVPDR